MKIYDAEKPPRLAASSYSNTAPLIWSFLYGANRGRYELILDNAPARSAELLRQKRVDAALVPVIEYQRIENARIIPNVCVAAKERARSVCLATRGEDLENVKTVALDVSSRTSVGLTKIIFREFLGREPIYTEAKPNLEEMLAEADCALLIGDPALAIAECGARSADLENKDQKAETENQYRKFDLVEIWKNYTDCGFVFAMWMANAERGAAAKRIDFELIRDEGLKHLDEVVANYKTISLTRADFVEYLSKNISYTVDDSLQKGLSLYFELARKHRLIEHLKPLRFLD